MCRLHDVDEPGKGANVGVVGDTRDLVLVRDLRSPIGRHFVFAQRFEGVPVHGAEVRVHYDERGRVIGANSSYVTGIALDSVDAAVPLDRALEAIAEAGPAASRGSALDLAGRGERLRRALPAARGTLVIYVLAGSAHLAWHVVAPRLRETWEAFVDARSGETLRPARDINRYATGTGQVFRVNAVVATRDNSLRDQDDSASAVPDTAYSLEITLGLGGVDDAEDADVIWSAALWQIRGALGAAKSDRLVLQHHFLISPGASFNEAANALVTAGIALGYKPAEVRAIHTILSNRGFTLTV